MKLFLEIFGWRIMRVGYSGPIHMEERTQMPNRFAQFLCALALLSLALPAVAQQPQPAIAKTHLKVGDIAPDFKLKDNNGKTVKLSSYRGKKNVVLAFYVLAFTGG